MTLEKLLNTFVPVDCLCCGVEGSSLCDACLPAAFDIIPSRCFLCKQVTDNYQVCKKCRKTTPLAHVYVGTAYSGLAKQLVYELKFRPDRTSGYAIAVWLNEVMSHINADVVTYVPTAQTRVRQRGFDHAKIIAEQFTRLREIPFQQLLVRHGNTRQVGAEKKARVEQIAGAYTTKKKLHGERVLLVDDITTTGATLSEAARTLKKNGALSVSAVVFAQAI